MKKKLLAGLLSAALLAGTATALPEVFDKIGAPIEAFAGGEDESGNKTDSTGTWYYSSDGSKGYIMGYSGKAANVTIPSVIDGDKVNTILSGVFNESQFKTIKISEGIEYVYHNVFNDCTNLESIDLPNSLLYLDHCIAFWGENKSCPLLDKQTGSVKYIDDWVYTVKEGVTSVKIKDGTRGIANWFAQNTDLKSITLPDSIEIIGDHTMGNVKLSSTVLPANLKRIGYEAFECSTMFTDLVLPDKVEMIDVQAFYCCNNLKTVVIPAKTKTIGPEAFAGCDALKEATILSKNVSIDPSAFGYEYDEEKGEVVAKVNKGFVIKCFKDSTADKFAKKYGITCKYIDTNLSSGKATIPYASYTYRGRGIKPTVTVKNNVGTKLKKDTDYTVSYSGNTNAGTATITVKGKGSYTGSLKKTFTVKALDLTSSYAKIEIPYSAYTYTGSAIKPAVTVKFKDGDVIPTDQYTVSYSNNTKVGTATITVKGKTSNVTGTYKKTFVVKPAKNEITSISTTSGAFKIKWKKGTAGTVGYQVLYSQDKAALNAASGEVKNSSAKKYVHSYTSTNLSDLSESFSTYPKSGETWYVKVRSFYTKDGKTTSTRYGNYSAVKSIKVK